MESEFEPALRTEETPEARIVILDVPGFRKENLKVQLDNRGNLIISGERSVKEIEEMAIVGGRSEKMQRFRKVIDIPQNLNNDVNVTAKFRDQTLRIFLPLRGHISDQRNQNAIPASGTPVQPAQLKDKSCPAGQADSIQEQSSVAQNVQRATNPQAIHHDGDKAKGNAAVEELKELVEGRKTEAPKLGEGSAHGEPPVSKDAQAVSAKPGAGDESQFIHSKSKHEEEKEVDEAEEETSENEDKGEGEGDELTSLPASPNDELPEKQFRIPSSARRSRRFFVRCCIVL